VHGAAPGALSPRAHGLADIVAGFTPAFIGLACILALAVVVGERAIGMQTNQMVGFSILFGFLVVLVVLAYRYGMNEDRDHEH